MKRDFRRSLAVKQALRQEKVLKQQTPYPVVRSQPPYAPGHTGKPIFFSLRCYEIGGAQEPQDQRQLFPGHTYVLVLIGDTDNTEATQSIMKECPQGISMDEDIALHVEFPMPLQQITGKARWSETLSGQEARQLEKEIAIFKLPEDAFAEQLTLSLSYRKSSRRYPFPLGIYSINVQGIRYRENEALLTECKINKGLPEGTILLRVGDVQGEGSSGCFEIRGWSGWRDPLTVTVKPRVTVSIAELEKKIAHDPEQIVSNLVKFSRTISSDLMRWLCAHEEKYQQELCVIFVDTTALEIPWEMLKLGDGKYLGALAHVVRWRPFQCYANEKWLEVKDHKHTGSVISYLAATLGKQETLAEQKALQRLKREDFMTLELLEGRIRQRLRHVGLIYIGCHGSNGQDLSDRRQKPSSSLKSFRLELFETVTQPLTVFVNACGSARMIDNLLNSSNFVEGFLTHIANGYIGTLASVDIQTASEIAEKILLRALKNKGVRITEVLRQLRVEAVKRLEVLHKLPPEKQKKEFNYVVDTFMYVYYGNPLTRLCLHTARDEQEGL